MALMEYSHCRRLTTWFPKIPSICNKCFGRYYFQQKAGVELGMDIISKQSIFDFEPQVDKSQSSILQLGIYSGYILPLNHFHFSSEWEPMYVIAIDPMDYYTIE